MALAVPGGGKPLSTPTCGARLDYRAPRCAALAGGARIVSGRALQDGATHRRRGRWRVGEQAEDLCRVGQLVAAGGADIHVPAHTPQTRLVQLAKDKVRQLSDDRQVIPQGCVAHRSHPGSRWSPHPGDPLYSILTENCQSLRQPSSPPRTDSVSRRRPSARRMRDLTVPSGSPSFAAISDWLNPSPYNRRTARWLGGSWSSACASSASRTAHQASTAGSGPAATVSRDSRRRQDQRSLAAIAAVVAVAGGEAR